MRKILFVCTGNQCRSPMAEYITKDYIEDLKLGRELYVESAGTLKGIDGRPIYPDAERVLNDVWINCSSHTARRITKSDYRGFDHIVCMDRHNIEAVEAITGGDPAGKISLLMSFPDDDGIDISDPMLTDDFEQAFKDIHYGCRMLLWKLM